MIHVIVVDWARFYIAFVSHSFGVHRLILASASPRRAEILRALNVPFVLAPVGEEEPRPTAHDEAEPQSWVEKLARFKAERCVVERCPRPQDESAPPDTIPDTVILAADTIVWHDGEILNKPNDANEAVAMLQKLRGQTHTVYTGVCLRIREEYFVAHEATRVRFGHVSNAWIRQYVATGEPLDKAGAYAAQGKGAILIESIEGDFWNVVGLPIFRLARMLENVGMPIESFWKR